MDNVKMLLIDVVKGEVKEVIPANWEEYHEYLNCELFDITRRTIGNRDFEIICDDCGLFKPKAIISALNSKSEMMFVGNLLIAGLVDLEGELTGLEDDDIKIIKDNIMYMIDFERGELIPVLRCEY